MITVFIILWMLAGLLTLSVKASEDYEKSWGFIGGVLLASIVAMAAGPFFIKLVED